jgi:hypothetical protein
MADCRCYTSGLGLRAKGAERGPAPREGVALKFCKGSAGLALAPGLAFVLSGCMGMAGDSSGTTALANNNAQPASAEQVDVRRYIGPDYCPEIRVREGTEVLRLHEGDRQDDPGAVIWQASVGETARDCLYDMQGNLELKVGVSGRAVAGPRGGPQTVTLPVRIALVKHREAIIANELHPLTLAIPATGAAVFSEVRTLNVPPLGNTRDYIVYVGLDEKGEDLLDPSAALVAKKKEAEEAKRRAELAAAEPVEPPPRPRKKLPPKPAAPAAPAGPKVLPTPTDGFILSR